MRTPPYEFAVQLWCDGLLDLNVLGAAASVSKVDWGIRRHARWGMIGKGGREVGMGGGGGRGCMIREGDAYGAVV